MDLRWLAVLVVVACTSHAVPPKPIVTTPTVGTPRTLELEVRDTDGPIFGALVSWGTDKAAITDQRGHVSVPLVDEVYVTVHAPDRATERLQVRDAVGPRIARTVTLAPGARVEGVVLDPKGQPVGDALVHFHVRGKVGETAKSDAAGRWVIDGIGAGVHEVSAWAPGFASWPPKKVIETDGVRTVTAVEVSLSSGATITGTVVDRRGAPVANARIEYSGNTDFADAQGRFICAALYPSDYTFYAVAGTAVSMTKKVAVAENGHATVQLVIDGPHAISGTVTGIDGKPVAANIVATGNDVMVLGKADRAGRYTLVAPPGKYQIRAQDTTGASPARDVSSDGRADLVIARPPTITGRVVAGGKPVPYFGISLVNYMPVAQRAADGRFTLADYAPGTYNFVIVAPGFLPHMRRGVVAVAGRTVDLGDVALERGRELRGRVVDASGRGLANATVQVSHDGDFTPPTSLDDLRHGRIAVTTDATGHYAIGGIDPTREARIEVSHGELRSTRRLLARGDAVVELSVGATGELAGALVPPPDGYTALVTVTSAANPAIVYQIHASSSGDFQIGRLPPGTYHVSTAGRATERITVSAGTRSKAALVPR